MVTEHSLPYFPILSSSLGHEGISKSILGCKKGALSDVVVIILGYEDPFPLSGVDGCLHLQ